MQSDPGANAGGNALSPAAVQAYWQGFDLEGLRSSLDERGLAIQDGDGGRAVTRLRRTGKGQHAGRRHHKPCRKTCHRMENGEQGLARARAAT